MRRFAATAAAVALALATATAAHAQAKPKIAVSSLTLPVFNPIVWNIMKARGLDTKNGFELDIHAYPSISAFYAGFSTGETEVLIGGPTILQKLYQEGVPLRIFGTGFTLADLVVFARDDKIKSLADLKGKQLAVNRGTISDTWATQNAEKYGFEVQRYDTFPDSVQAVITRRAFTALNEIPTTVYAASQNKAIKVGFKDYNGRNFGYAFRLESVPYRNTVEEAIECMKLDGTLAKLHEKWYGSPPDQTSTINAVFVGYGPPGFKGYEFKPHVPSCK